MLFLIAMFVQFRKKSRFTIFTYSQ